jgi:hypothetical protein
MERMKLGRVSPVASSLSRLPLFGEYAAGLPDPPAVEDWRDGVDTGLGGALGNDTVGCCTCATLARMEQVFIEKNGGSYSPDTQLVLDTYATVTGWTPNDPSTDNGAVMVDVLNYWMQTGFGGRKLAAYSRARAGHTKSTKQAIAFFGGVCLGVAFPPAWFEDDVWDTGRGHDYIPDGGHEVPAFGYNKDGLVVVSWGRVYLLTWRAVARYVEEIQVPVSADWADSDLSPSGFALNQLVGDLGMVTAIKSA